MICQVKFLALEFLPKEQVGTHWMPLLHGQSARVGIKPGNTVIAGGIFS
jgi:hypothetical protein